MFDTLANGGGHPVMTTCRTRPRRGVPDEVSGTSPPAPRHRHLATGTSPPPIATGTSPPPIATGTPRPVPSAIAAKVFDTSVSAAAQP